MKYFFLNFIFRKELIQRIIVWILIGWVFFLLRDFLVLFLGTFLLAYLFHHGAVSFMNFNTRWIEKISRKRIRKFFMYIFWFKTSLVYLYIIFIGILIFLVSSIAPRVLTELWDFTNKVPIIQEETKVVQNTLEEIGNFRTDFVGRFSKFATEKNITILKEVFKNVKDIWGIVIQFFISIVLSFVFIIDRRKTLAFLERAKKSNFSFVYREFEMIFNKIVQGFGPIFKAQFLIAFVNTIITIFGYIVIGVFFGGFPYVLTLAFIVFLASFIPVLGMWISAIPIIITVYTTAGWEATLAVFFMILSTSMFEAYFLNPRVVSSYMEIPISLTFLILVVSEQIFGIIGMLIGMPIFYIILNFIRDVNWYIDHVKIIYRDVELTKISTKEKLKKSIRLSRSQTPNIKN